MQTDNRKDDTASASFLPSIQARARWQPKQNQMRRWWFDSWFVEIMALSLCTTSAIALCVVLIVFDKHPVPLLPKSLTMNSIVAFLSTIAKSSLLLVVSSCISQLKWTWYQNHRTLADTQLFEDASRGPLGSLQMLFQHRIRSTACIGAAILILALLFEPFVQQVLTYPNVTTFAPSEFALAKQAQRFSFDGIHETSGSFALRQAVVSGIWFEDFSIMPSCPLGDCQWETYPSVGFCSSCGPANPRPRMDCNFDFSSQVKNVLSEADLDWTDKKSCSISFLQDNVSPAQIDVIASRNASDGYNWSIEAPAYAMFSLYEADLGWSPEQFLNNTIQGVENPLFAFTLVHFELLNTSIEITDAEECTLHFCQQNYTPEVVNGVSQTTISNIYSGSGMFEMKVDFNESSTSDVICWTSKTDRVDPGQASKFAVNASFSVYSDDFSLCMTPSTLSILTNTIIDPFWGYLPQSIYTTCESSTGCEKTNQVATLDYNLAYDAAYDTDLGSGDQDPVYRVYTAGASTVMKNIASSLTLLTTNTKPTLVQGRVGSLTTLVRVRWAWLTLPLVLILLSIGLFAWTVFDTKRHKLPLWKSSVLAFLFHGLQPHLLEEHRNIELVSLMEAKSDYLKVSLRRVDPDGTIMFSSRTSPRSVSPKQQGIVGV